MSDLTLLLAVLAVLLSLARASGSAAARLGQPAVIGEIACGLLVGVAMDTGPELPGRVGTTLDALAQLGLTLFLFCVGARLAPSMTERRVRAALVPALGAIVVPVVLGALLALWLARRHAPAGVTPFVLFAAAAMAVTAFPVLARILAERDMLDDAGGQRALSAAAITDAAAWTALAFVAASLHEGIRLWSLALTVALLVALCRLARPWFGRLAARLPRQTTVAILVSLACAGAATTELAGLHSAVGAFLTGVAVGRSAHRIEPATLVAPVGALLVPLYFVLVGRRVDLGGLDLLLVAETAAVIAVAVAGKCGGPTSAPASPGNRPTRPRSSPP